MLKKDIFVGHIFLDKVVIHFNVFGSCMKNWIYGKS
jgi:hypothetical protein